MAGPSVGQIQKHSRSRGYRGHRLGPREGKLILTSSAVKLVPRLGWPVHGGSSGRLCQQGLQKSMVSSLTPASVLTLSE
jgi:hypothetical protein